MQQNIPWEKIHALEKEIKALKALGKPKKKKGEVKKEAKKYGLSTRDWVIKLFIHAILHLEGYTHEHDRNAQKMEKLEDQIFKNLNLKL